jgi:hypothetical protein
MMQIKLINGVFNTTEALDLISQMLNVKIKYHEDKIVGAISEEDIKFRESKIKSLQNELHNLRELANDGEKFIKIESNIIGSFR